MGQFVERSKRVGYGEFLAYEIVRRSGETNMNDVARVIELSEGRLTKENVREIMVNFVALENLYPVGECPECEGMIEVDLFPTSCPHCDPPQPDDYIPGRGQF